MQKVLSTIKNYAVSVIAPALMIVILLLVSPETRSMNSVISLLRQGFAPAVLGWGVLFNMKVGNWDFSIGARFVLACIVAGRLSFGIDNIALALIVYTVSVIALSCDCRCGLQVPSDPHPDRFDRRLPDLRESHPYPFQRCRCAH